MNLLVISNNPERASFRQRIGVYLDTLRSEGIDCEAVKLPAGTVERRKLFKRAEDFEGVLLHKKGLNFFDAWSLRRYGGKVIYDFDDALMYRARSPERNSRLHFKRFCRSVKSADMVIAGNSYLAEHAWKLNSNVRILATGLDTSVYNVPRGLKDDDKVRLVWIGSKSTLRYLAEIKPALEEVGRRFKDAVLRIIADEFFDLENMAVEKLNWSQDREAADLVTSDIGLAPLPDNRFTRGKCGFKILQYAAAGLPAVTSPVGVNAEYVDDGVSGFHAVKTGEWIEKISELVSDRRLREEMGKAGKTMVGEFDIKVLGQKLAGLIKEQLSV